MILVWSQNKYFFLGNIRKILLIGILACTACTGISQKKFAGTDIAYIYGQWKYDNPLSSASLKQSLCARTCPFLPTNYYFSTTKAISKYNLHQLMNIVFPYHKSSLIKFNLLYNSCYSCFCNYLMYPVSVKLLK